MTKPNLSHAFGSLVPEPGPRRVFSVSTLVNTFGFGLVWTVMTLYFVRVVHLSTGQVGVGMTVAGLVGMLAGVPIGDLADRRGPREIVRATMLIQCVVTLCYVFIHGFAAFVIVVTLEMLCFGAYGAANGALVRRVGGDDATVFRSKTRAISNFGMSLGALGCGVAVEINTVTAYHVLIILNTATFVISWAILGRLPHYAPQTRPKSEGSRWVALTDRPFVVYVFLAGALSMQYWVTTGPLPLWVLSHTHAARWCIPLFQLINTLMVVLFQVGVGNRVKSILQGGTALRRAGVIFLLSCSAMGLAAGLPGWAALLLLIGAVVLHTFGELWFAAGSYTLDFGLAPEHAQGQYQGVAGMGITLGGTAAPVLMIGLVLTLGRAGWIGLGALFALLGLAAPAVARWGQRTRPVPVSAGEAEVTLEAEHAVVGE
jgi:MFS family permease